MGKARLVRYADDFVIVCRPGQAREVLERTKRWLNARGLSLNEKKTRMSTSRDFFSLRLSPLALSHLLVRSNTSRACPGRHTMTKSSAYRTRRALPIHL